jgi:hypothetical protein
MLVCSGTGRPVFANYFIPFLMLVAVTVIGIGFWVS